MLNFVIVQNQKILNSDRMFLWDAFTNTKRQLINRILNDYKCKYSYWVFFAVESKLLWLNYDLISFRFCVRASFSFCHSIATLELLFNVNTVYRVLSLVVRCVSFWLPELHALMSDIKIYIKLQFQRMYFILFYLHSKIHIMSLNYEVITPPISFAHHFFPTHTATAIYHLAHLECRNFCYFGCNSRFKFVCHWINPNYCH